jgi:hypothetical protein
MPSLRELDPQVRTALFPDLAAVDVDGEWLDLHREEACAAELDPETKRWARRWTADVHGPERHGTHRLPDDTSYSFSERPRLARKGSLVSRHLAHLATDENSEAIDVVAKRRDLERRTAETYDELDRQAFERPALAHEIATKRERLRARIEWVNEEQYRLARLSSVDTRRPNAVAPTNVGRAPRTAPRRRRTSSSSSNGPPGRSSSGDDDPHDVAPPRRLLRAVLRHLGRGGR